jgi:hypothetical protein
MGFALVSMILAGIGHNQADEAKDLRALKAMKAKLTPLPSDDAEWAP